jgi:hypothetical protein
VLGVRLVTPRVPDTAQKKRLSGFRWRKPEKVGQSPWEQGFAPPDLPNEPLPVPYFVPAAHIQPTLVIKHADNSTLLQAVAKYGARFCQNSDTILAKLYSFCYAAPDEEKN